MSLISELHLMPVLSDKEREEQIQYCLDAESRLLSLIENFIRLDEAEAVISLLKKDLRNQQIALASLMAKPVCYYGGEAYYNTLKAALKDGATEVIGLYECPPVSVKKDLNCD